MSRASLFLIAALFASACASKPPARSAEQESFESHLTDLVQKSQKTLPTCDAYRRAVLETLKGVRQDGTFVAESKKSLAAAEKLIPRYPGAPQAYFRAVRYVMKELKLPEGENWNASLVFNANACEYSRFFEISRTVVASAEAYQLPKKQRLALGKTILNKVRQNMREPQLALPTFASIYLTRSLGTQGFAKINSKAIEKLLLDSETVREQLKETRPRNEGIVFELQQVNSLRRRLLKILGSP